MSPLPYSRYCLLELSGIPGYNLSLTESVYLFDKRREAVFKCLDLLEEKCARGGKDPWHYALRTVQLRDLEDLFDLCDTSDGPFARELFDIILQSGLFDAYFQDFVTLIKNESRNSQRPNTMLAYTQSFYHKCTEKPRRKKKHKTSEKRARKNKKLHQE